MPVARIRDLTSILYIFSGGSVMNATRPDIKVDAEGRKERTDAEFLACEQVTVLPVE